MTSRGTKSIVINFNDLYAFNPGLAIQLLNDPKNYLSCFNSATFLKLQTINPQYANNIKYLRLRIRELPSVTPLYKMGANEIGKLVMVYGMITRVGAVKPHVLRSAHRCNYCGQIIYQVQNGLNFKRPGRCTFCNKNSFNLFENESLFTDSQWITIQEIPSYHYSKRLDVLLKDDLVRVAKVKDNVTVIGYMELVEEKRKGSQVPFFDYFLQANYVEVK